MVLTDRARARLWCLIRARMATLQQDKGQVNVVVLGLSSDTQPASLHVGKYDTDEFAKGCWIQSRHSFITTSFGVSLEDSVSTN